MIFLHMPKTAGHSFKDLLRPYFRSVFEINCEADAISADLAAVGSHDLIFGHMPYGIHNHLKDNHKYFVVLRNPVDRFVSDFFYIRQSPQHPMHAIAQDMTLQEYAGVDSRVHHMAYNSMTRRLLSIDFNSSAWWVKDAHLDLHCLDDARQMLFDKIINFGIFEDMGKTLAILAGMVGTDDHMVLMKLNTTLARPSVSHLDRSLVDTIKASNSFDVLLYEDAIKHFSSL